MVEDSSDAVTTSNQARTGRLTTVTRQIAALVVVPEHLSRSASPGLLCLRVDVQWGYLTSMAGIRPWG